LMYDRVRLDGLAGSVMDGMPQGCFVFACLS
jgi:hypothetical protein